MHQVEHCNTYAEDLRAEHRQIHACVRKIQNALFMDTASRCDLLRQLSALDATLRRHFVEEEEGGCLEEAVSRCPCVSAEADASLRQHAGLLEELQALSLALEATGPGTPTAAVEAEFDRFAKSLLAH